ncbi:BON domain-containing protein [Telmatospirillum sp. J64-1]|uniref:BON domain-containing protein n=1 Tax=Telmatospirillum sp. J64-1 TaxID=2502183 RepID=UPI002105BF0F|nr:BON domain-containing protein [Telmatospirillum sp. J64-1]
MTICRLLPALAACGLVALSTACVPVVVGAGATAGVAAVQERGFSGAVDDTRIRAEINHLWFQHSEEIFRKVDLRITEGRVLLTGQVPTPEDRVDAVRLAWQANGVREVLNEIQVGETSGLMDMGRDSIIANRLRTRLLTDSAIRNVNYSVDTVNGVVYIMGLAQDQEELDRVIGHARSIPNVRQVVSHVVLRDDPARFQR